MQTAAPNFVPQSVILEMFPWIPRQKLRRAGAKGIVTRREHPTRKNRFEYDLASAKKWATKRRKRRIFAEGTYRLRDKRGRRLIALRIVSERFGIDRDTYLKWHREGCAIMGGAKPDLWEDIYLKDSSGALHQTFFGDFDFIKKYIAKRKELAMATVLSAIPAGWGTWKQALQTGIPAGRLRAMMKAGHIKRDWIHWPAPGDGMARTLILLLADVQKFTDENLEKTLTYPGLIVAYETGIALRTLKYLFDAGKLTYMEKKPALDPRGHVQLQWHFLRTEIDAQKPRLEERSKLGSRKYWIGGKDFYPGLEALANFGVTTFELWKWRPVAVGGLGKPCESLKDDKTGMPRCLACKTRDAGYRSKYSSMPIYAGDDLRLIEATKRGWAAPRPAPAPPAEGDLSGIHSKLDGLESTVIKTGDSVTTRLQRSIRASKETAAAADGPGPNFSFLWSGKSIAIQPKDWRLLDYVWKSPSRSAEIEKAIDESQDGDLSGAALKNRIKRISAALLEIGCPHSMRSKGGKIYVE